MIAVLELGFAQRMQPCSTRGAMRRLAWMTSGLTSLLGVWHWTSRPLGIPHSEFRLEETNTLILGAGENVELLLGAENLCG